MRSRGRGRDGRDAEPLLAARDPGAQRRKRGKIEATLMREPRVGEERDIRNGETLVCVQAATDERIKTAVALLKLYTPIEVKVVPAAQDPVR